jgi:hypothetical protein
MDARQTGIHRAAMQYGAAYATVLPGDTGPVIHGYSPRRMTAIYQDPEIDDWPFMAIDDQRPDDPPVRRGVRLLHRRRGVPHLRPRCAA